MKQFCDFFPANNELDISTARAFHFAGQNDIEPFKQLIENGVLIESCNNTGDRLIVHALLCHALDCAKFLISCGADINTPCINGHTPLTRLCGETSPFEHEIRFLITHGAHVNSINATYETALSLAVCCNNINHAKLLLKSNADISSVVNQIKSELITCFIKRRYEMAKLLIDFGADVNVTNLFNLSPLHAAITECPEKEQCKIYFPMLLAAGASINTWTNDGNSPFLQAVINRNSDLVKLLLMNKHELGCGRIISDEVERLLLHALDMRCCTSAVININVMFFGSGEDCDTSKICNKHPIIYRMREKTLYQCLQAKCRQSIRNTLQANTKTNLYYLVNQLSLPTYLQDYVLFKF